MDEIKIISPTFHSILDEMEHDSNHLVITGKAGTGKSTLLNLFRQTTKKNAVILAPTGIAALNIKGQTIHSFFKFPPRLLSAADLRFIFPISKILRQLEILVIDEMSMVRADVIDAIDGSLRLHRKINSPFGGVKLILFGDMYQLPPVISSKEEYNFFFQNYDSPFFFSSTAWKSLNNINYIELNEVFRQTDPRFIRLLDEIRHHLLDEESLAELNELYTPDFGYEEGFIYLSPRNATMERINRERLDMLPHVARSFNGELKGNFNEKNLPTDQTLILKIGSQVMVLRNDTEMEYVNGTIGTIVEMKPDEIIISNTSTGELATIKKAKWEMIQYNIDPENEKSIQSKIVGTYTQFPLRLAWAMSIHKSQGQTFEQVVLDMEGGAFEHGQTYVALSRCTSMEGLKLKRKLTPRDFIMDERILDFQSNFR